MIITTFFSKNCENFTSCGMSCGSCMTSSVKWWKARVTAISFPRFLRWSRRKVSNFHESRVGERCKVATTPEQVPATRTQIDQKVRLLLLSVVKPRLNDQTCSSNIALEECALPFNRCLLLRRFVFRTEASAKREGHKVNDWWRNAREHGKDKNERRSPFPPFRLSLLPLRISTEICLGRITFDIWSRSITFSFNILHHKQMFDPLATSCCLAWHWYNVWSCSRENNGKK